MPPSARSVWAQRTSASGPAVSISLTILRQSASRVLSDYTPNESSAGEP